MIGPAQFRNWIFPGVIGLLAIISCFMGCTYSVSQTGSSMPGIASPVPGTSGTPGVVLGYNSLKTQIFTPYCISCHGNSGGVNLETYASAVSSLNQIENAVVVQKSMPPSGPLSAANQALIQAWVNAGGPENDISVPAPSPSASPSPTPTA